MTDTIEEILSQIRTERTLSREQLYRYIRALGIKPAGANQRPQRYPEGTALKILAHLGFRAGVPKSDRILTLKQIKARAARRD